MADLIETSDQERFELRALEILAHPRMRNAVAAERTRWLGLTPPRQDMANAFERYYPEVVFGAIIWSLNCDSERPAVVTISRVPHRLRGHIIPGSRWGIDNPDTVYRVIPISGAERYIIRGRVAEKRLTENYFTLWDASMGTVDVLDGKALVLDPDGRFEITVDADPKGGRPNHIRSTPEAREFYIRDVLMDWAHESVNELSIERLGGAPSRPAPTFDEQVDAAIAMLTKNIDNTIRWNAQARDKPVNLFDFTIDRDSDGALRNQLYIMGHFDLSPEEALVIDVGLGGAGYFLAPISNWWGTTNEIIHRNGSLNLSQSERNPNGNLTYVVSLKDPGVHNWLDPCGMAEGILTLRWAEFADGRPGTGFGATSRVVPLAHLKTELHPDTRWLTQSERHTQLQARAASYVRRISEPVEWSES